MRTHCLAVAVVGTVTALICAPVGAPAQEFQMQEAPTLPPLAAGALAPRTIVFTDHRKDELVDPVTGLIHFADWERARPQQKQLLSLFPAFEEPTLPDSTGKSRKRRLQTSASWPGQFHQPISETPVPRRILKSPTPIRASTW